MWIAAQPFPLKLYIYRSNIEPLIDYRIVCLRAAAYFFLTRRTAYVPLTIETYHG